MNHYDVVIVGAGIAGIGSAWHLQRMCPDRSFVMMEARDAIGGTWDLFRYPGVRSDSDMHTLGFRFKPWLHEKAIADGPSILDYLEETVAENDLGRHIRFNHRITRAQWSSDEACWTLTVETPDGESAFTCAMLLMCGGYYRYDRGHDAGFEGMEDFAGTIVHPQFWPDDLDHAGKKVVVIGSGATAMTIVPAMARDGAHVTMVQRSPTYVVSWPGKDAIANRLRQVLPDDLAYAVTRYKNIKSEIDFYRRTRTEPEAVKAELIGLVKEALGPDYDVETHFTPAYFPWDQRLCLIPDDDLFEVIKSGDAEVVTDRIDRFTGKGLRLESGTEIEADIIVTATGLELQVMAGIKLAVDGEAVSVPDHWTYNGMMLSDVPNLIQTFGYINASWTLKADLTAEFACRVLNRMAETGTRQVTPRLRAGDRDMPARPWIDDFPAGYILRGIKKLPKQGDRDPWRHTQDYLEDCKLIREAPVADDVLEYTNPARQAAGAAAR